MDLAEFYKAYAPKIPGRILLARVGGSQSYNTNTPSSDTDFLGVYAAWTEDVLSLTPPQDTIASAEGTKPDYTVHEVKKFCSLLMSGNPTVLEFIFSDKFQIATMEWSELASNKKMFLTQKAVKNYCGYARGQIQRMLKGQSVHGLHGQPSEKFSYHIIRLLNDAKAIAEGKEPQIYKTGEEHDFLMKIRGGAFSPDQIAEMAQQKINEIDVMRPWLLPAEVDKSFLNKWLLQIREANYNPST
jgi:predicted nucleotidyltransferase